MLKIRGQYPEGEALGTPQHPEVALVGREDVSGAMAVG
jgi:hypothetical protein